MDLIYADSNRVDIGVLKDYDFDLAYGVDENDFSLKITLNQHCCKDDYIIYMIDTQNGIESPTEYGGIIDTIAVDTASQTVTYSGRTWHGILSRKVIQPEAGQDYRTADGNANEVINSLLSDAGLTGLFRVDGSSQIEINDYQFKRYTDLYSGICDMLAAFGGKLQTRYDEKMVVLNAVWLVDYSQEDEWDSSQVDFAISQTKNPVNHLVCLGQGDLKDRYVIHLFTDENGGIQPYATTDEPVSDADYILTKENQQLFNEAEIAEAYDNSSAAFTENYVLMDEQPADWDTKYGNYFTKKDDSGFAEVEGTETETLTVLSSQPSNWSDRYSNYYTADGKAVQGVETETYTALESKPSDWKKNYNNYYVHFWDGTQWHWNQVAAKTWKTYEKQTKKPSDWQKNFGSYYMLETKYKTVTDKNGKSVKGADGKVLKKKVGTGYTNVKKEKKGNKEVVPTWKKNKYFTMYNHSSAPAYKTGLLPKYKKEKSTVAPTWAANTYYSKTRVIVKPPWKTGVYYRMMIDHYAELVAGGIERLQKEVEQGDSIKINLSLLGDYDVGDIVGATENVTGISVWQAITKKIINIKNGRESISYQIGAVK